MTKGDIRVTIPNVHHGKDIGIRLLTQILQECDISRDEWLSSDQ
jgi:predicted RNA binding protein YcfA (HicA-like mRNA interferase family)